VTFGRFMDGILILIVSLNGNFNKYFSWYFLNTLIIIYFLYLEYNKCFKNPSFSNKKALQQMPKGWKLSGSPNVFQLEPNYSRITKHL